MTESVKLLRLSEAAELLSISKSTIWRMVKAGTIPAARIGRQWRIKPADLQAYITAAQATNPDGGGA